MGVYLRKEFNLRYSCKACVGEVHRFIGKVIGKVKSEVLWENPNYCSNLHPSTCNLKAEMVYSFI